MPSSPGYKRNYKQEDSNDSSARKAARADRNKARRIEVKRGLAHIGDGMDVGHIKAESKGGRTSLANIEMQTPTSNRSFSRTKTGAMKSEHSKKEIKAGKPAFVTKRKK